MAEIIWGLLALNQLRDVARVRRRLADLPVLAASDVPVDSELCFVCAPGVSLSEETRRAVSAHMAANQLRGLDLVPGQARLSTAWSLGCHVDAEGSRRESWSAGATGVHAFVVERSALGAKDVAASDLGTFVAHAREVKRMVQGAHGLAIAPELTAVEPNPFFDAEVEQALYGGGMGPVTVGLPLMWLIVFLGVWLAPVMGLAVLALAHLQQPIALRGGAVRVSGMWGSALLRLPVDMMAWRRLLRGRLGIAVMDDADRATYQSLVEGGLAPFFSTPRLTCPICGEDTLGAFLKMGDLHLGKPGKFELSRCSGCGHIFQNPQLNPDGLNYYYKDAYDGRNAVGMDLLFGSYVQPYLDRIDMVAAETTPSRWLDVGCGHGHLCVHGRSRLPDTRFEGLDMGESVEIALTRGWIDTAHRGLFPTLAPELKGGFDVVSMSHYLEHTLEPRTELAAAHTVLGPDGLLLIELPDPDSPWARWLGRYWMPWFQPQHLHLLSTVNLAKLLREAGFEPLRWETGRAHQATDLFLAAVCFLRWWAPPLDVPWRPKPRLHMRLWNGIVWGPGLGLLLIAIILDRLLAPIGRRMHHSSAFRVVARRR